MNDSHNLPTQERIDFNQVEFFVSAPNYKAFPNDAGIEVAFVGRSNAGKSSAINTIVGRNGLARTSKTPGRTQSINFFSVDDDRRLADLPGYGYAKVPDRIKKQIEGLLSDYLSSRHSLHGIFMMMDIRHPMTPYDRELLDFMAHTGKPIHILLTKSDKLKRGAANNTLLSVKKQLGAWENQITVQTFSSLKNLGIEQAQDVLNQWMQF